MINLEDLWEGNQACSYEFNSNSNLHFTCENLGPNPVSFSVMLDNQELVECNFTITITGDDCGSDYCESWGAANSGKFIQEFSFGYYTNSSGNNYGYGDFTSEMIQAESSSNQTVPPILPICASTKLLSTSTSPEAGMLTGI